MYKCVHCSSVFSDASKEVLEGCSKCNSKFFFYVKKEQLEEMNKKAEAMTEVELNSKEKIQMEKDVREITGIEDEEKPVFLDFESIKIMKPGKYLLDISKLFDKTKPRVYKLEDGKYIIDLAPNNLSKNRQTKTS